MNLRIIFILVATLPICEKAKYEVWDTYVCTYRFRVCMTDNVVQLLCKSPSANAA